MTSSMSSSFHSGWPGGRQLKVPQINTISEIESIITDRKRSLGQGNIFAPVCHSVHRVGSTWAGTPRAGTPPLTVHAGLRSTSERYASYWNAFLLIIKI